MISSAQNDQVKYLVSLHRHTDRLAQGRFLLEGALLVREALARGAAVEKIYYCPELLSTPDLDLPAQLPSEQVTAPVMQKISTTVSPQGLLAVAKVPQHSWNDLTPADGIILILDEVQDPGNLGTILRTALAAGVHNICLTPGTADLYNPKVVRATMGMFFSQKIITQAHPADILSYRTEQNCSLAVCSMRGQSIYALEPLPRPLLVVVGNETRGVNRLLSAAADVELAIPMKGGVESLNAAMAAGLCLFELQRQADFLKP
jgi:TrmH family RNA methyltransferase